MKRERTIENTPNFQQILLNIWITLIQNVNAIACFFLELFSRLHYLKICEDVLLQNANKQLKKHQTFSNYFWTSGQSTAKISMPQLASFFSYLVVYTTEKTVKVSSYRTGKTIEKAPNFQQIPPNIYTIVSQNFNTIACFFYELFSRLHYLKICEDVLL